MSLNPPDRSWTANHPSSHSPSPAVPPTVRPHSLLFQPSAAGYTSPPHSPIMPDDDEEEEFRSRNDNIKHGSMAGRETRESCFPFRKSVYQHWSWFTPWLCIPFTETCEESVTYRTDVVVNNNNSNTSRPLRVAAVSPNGQVYVNDPRPTTDANAESSSSSSYSMWSMVSHSDNIQEETPRNPLEDTNDASSDAGESRGVEDATTTTITNIGEFPSPDGEVDPMVASFHCLITPGWVVQNPDNFEADWEMVDEEDSVQEWLNVSGVHSGS